MNHNPAPWKIIRVGEYTDDPADTAIMSVQAANGQTVLYTDSGYFKPLEGDARLIEAAPDLLAALERALNWFSSYPGEGTLRLGGIYDQARAAIAKAKGGAE